MFRLCRLFRAVRSAANTRHEQHSDFATRCEHLRVVTRPADKLRCLGACTVGPGFEFADFSLAVDWPEIAAKIASAGTDLARFI